MNENYVPRTYLSVLRILLGVILLVTWKENLDKGLYTADGFRNFIEYLAAGHPLELYRWFLLSVIAPISNVFGVFQMFAELAMGLALLTGALTRLTGTAATFFFFNLFLAYLNPNPGEWIWTYVMLVVIAAVVTLGRAGRTWGIDGLIYKRRIEQHAPA